MRKERQMNDVIWYRDLYKEIKERERGRDGMRVREMTKCVRQMKRSVSFDSLIERL